MTKLREHSREICYAHLGVLGQHLLKGLRHRIAPEEVVVEGSVRVDPGRGVEGKEKIKL